jgi:Glycosyltransferase
LGAVNNIDALYEDAAIFCFPSRFEGFGLALAEAQAFGIPSIAFDCDCGPSEIIDENCGILISDIDGTLLSQALAQLMSRMSQRQDMSINARLKAQSFFIGIRVFNMD